MQQVQEDTQVDERAAERRYMEFRNARFDEHDMAAARNLLWADDWEWKEEGIDINGEWRGWWTNDHIDGAEHRRGNPQEYGRGAIQAVTFWTTVSLDTVLEAGNERRRAARLAMYSRR